MIPNALNRRIEALPLRTRIAMTLLVGAAITLIVGAGSIWGIRWFQAQMDELFQQTTLTVHHAQDAHLQLVKIRRSIGNLLIVTTDKDRFEARQDLQKAREQLDRSMALALENVNRPALKTPFLAVERQMQSYLVMVDRAVGLIDRRSPEATAFVTGPEFHEAKKKIEEAVNLVVQELLQQAEADLKMSRDKARLTVWLVTLLSLLGLLAVSVLARALAGSIHRPHDQLVQTIEAIAGGQHDKTVPYVELPNETGKMARALEVLRQTASQTAEDHWIKDRAASLMESIRVIDSPDELARRILSGLAPLMALGHAVFYRVQTDGQLVLAASYAMTQRKRVQTAFQPGEGLPGQCLQERQPIHLVLPSDHVTIVSGLGEAPAVQVMAWPLVAGDSVVAVMELAAYSEFTPRHRRLLETLSMPLASTLQVLDRNLRTQELLSLARSQSDQMQKQAARLEEQTVELEAQQAEMRDAERWFRIIIDHSQEPVLVVDQDGIIAFANPAADQLFGHPDGATQGTPLRRVIPQGLQTGRPAPVDALKEATKLPQADKTRTLRARRVDGMEFGMEVELMELPSRGALGGCLSVFVRRVHLADAPGPGSAGPVHAKVPGLQPASLGDV